MTQQFSDKYSIAYDLLNANKPYKDEVGFMLGLYDRFSKNKGIPQTVLDLGCGSGKHLAEFSADVAKSGVDQSSDMLKVAESKNIPNVSFELSDICQTSFDGTFDLVYSLFHVLSYQTTDETLVDFFKTIHKHLNQKGISVVDFWHRSAWDLDPPVTRVTKKSNELMDLVRVSTPTFDRLNGLVEIEMDLFARNTADEEYERISEHHKMRAYTLSELALAAKLAGLSIVSSGAWMEHNIPLSANDWYGWLVLTPAK